VQKVGVLLLTLFTVTSVAADKKAAPTLRDRLRPLIRDEIERQVNPGGGMNLEDSIKSLSFRLTTLIKSVGQYSSVKQREYNNLMKRSQDEVARACCPLKSSNFLEGVNWYGAGAGMKRGLKALSGQKPKRPRAMKAVPLQPPAPVPDR
jgi:hypothetical protein